MSTPLPFEREDAESLALRHEIAAATQGVVLAEVARLMAHGINQPLAAVVANGGACLRWLQREPLAREEAEAAVRRLVADAHRAAETIRDIQAFVQREPPPRAPESLARLVDAALQLAAPVAATRNVSIRLDIAERLPAADVNRAQMLYVLLSLVTNACEALERVPEPRTVEVFAKRRGEAELEVGVRDNGPGLGATGRDRNFEPFHTSKPGGMGLGLAVSRTIVESHGGRLWASPNAGEGETFCFTLPARP